MEKEHINLPIIVKSRKKYFEEGFQTELAPHSLVLPDEVLKYFRPDMFVLNCGCGGASNAEKSIENKLRNAGVFMVGVDINKHQIDLARQALLPSDKFDFVVADCTDMHSLIYKNRDDSKGYLNQIAINAAIAQGMLSCLDPEDQEKAAKEIFKLLSPNSVLIINEFELDKFDKVQNDKHERDEKITGYYPARVIWNPDKPHNILFITEDFSEERLRELAENAGFEVIDIIRTEFLSGEGPIEQRKRKQITVVAHKPFSDEQRKVSYLPLTSELLD